MRTLPLGLAALLVLSGCFNVSWNGGERIEGSGQTTTRTVQVDGARSVSLGAPGALVVERGASPLVIEGDDNLVERLRVEVKSGELVIETPDGESFDPQAPLRYRVGIDRLEGVEVAGSGRVEATSAEADAFVLSMAGSGSADVSGIRAESVSVEIAGSGGVTVAGRTARLDVDIAGSGDVDAKGLTADEAQIDIAGSGDVTLRAEKTLGVDIVGSGDVQYYGSPQVSRSVMGSGGITRAGD